jgi:hypothetical protein
MGYSEKSFTEVKRGSRSRIKKVAILVSFLRYLAKSQQGHHDETQQEQPTQYPNKTIIIHSFTHSLIE